MQIFSDLIDFTNGKCRTILKSVYELPGQSVWNTYYAYINNNCEGISQFFTCIRDMEKIVTWMDFGMGESKLQQNDTAK